MLDASMLDDVVLYDIMYEAGTRLGGVMSDLWYRAKARGDKKGMDHWLGEQKRLQVERAAVPADDRQAQVGAYDRWTAEAEDLYFGAWQEEYGRRLTRQEEREAVDNLISASVSLPHRPRADRSSGDQDGIA